MLGRLALLTVVLAGCDETPYEIDPFPMGVSTDAGVPTSMASVGDAAPVPIVLDTGSPLTVMNKPGITQIRAPLTLLGNSPGGTLVPRMRFISAPMLLAPVLGTGLGDASGPLHPIEGVVGGDLLSLLSVRFDLAHDQVFFFPDIATSENAFYAEGAAVLEAPKSGGGSFELEGGVVEFLPSRMVVGTCLEQEDLGIVAPPEGDALLVLATGLDRLVLSESAFTRARRTTDPTFDPATLVYDTPYWLPAASEPLTVATGQLDRLAFAADESKDRGPCDELWMNRLMQVNGCIRGKKCPCPDSERSCAAGSIVEITAVLPVAILHDEEEVLQGLRDELRPGSADVDGFLGADIVKMLILDVDYIHNRLIFRCADPVTCKTTIRIPDLDHQPP